MDFFALIISILAFGLSILQFLRDSSREKKESTLVAYNTLQDDVFSPINKYKKSLSDVVYLSDEWEKLTVYLAKIERFSVGINSGIYSIDILDRLGGAYYIRLFEKLKVIIDKKREENVAPGKHYDEFETTVSMLKEYRSQNSKLQKMFFMFKKGYRII